MSASHCTAAGLWAAPLCCESPDPPLPKGAIGLRAGDCGGRIQQQHILYSKFLPHHLNAATGTMSH